MQTCKVSILTLAAIAVGAAAQNTTSSTPAGSQVQIQSSNQYSNSSLIGYHVGAGLSYIVAGAPGVGNSFAYNSSAAADQLLDNNIAIGIPLPCYVIATSQISNNSGPLECGAGDQPGYYDIAQLAGPSDTTPGAITFEGISAWYVCAVQSFTYGWVPSTVVGSYADGEPSGPGIQNCTSIEALFLADNSTTGGDNGSDGDGNPTLPTTTGSGSAAPTATVNPSTSSGSANCSVCSVVTTVITLPCPSSTAVSDVAHQASATATSTTTTGPIATFTGSATTLALPGWSALALVITVLLL